MNTAMAVDPGYKTLPLSMLDESSTNPRRTFEPTKLVELAHSISIHGLIQPITVRPKGDRFEVIAGARRFRAAKIAELPEIPTRILDLSDEQTLEVQIIENSQREDVHPYEEAAGYQRLLDLPGYDVAALSSKCGKSISHVYARLTLLQLIPDVAHAFQQERITASHANQLARLTPEQQAEAFKQCFRKDYRDEEEHLLPAKYLASWINENLYLALAEAPFPTDDPTLNPEAGSCIQCPRRTGFNTQLFADVKDDNCLDAACYRTKVATLISRHSAANPELVQISSEWRPAGSAPEGQLLPHQYTVVKPATGEDDETKPACPSAVPAIIAHGSNVGRTLEVCTNRECPVHHPRHTPSSNAPDFEEKMQQAQEERDQRKWEREKREERLRALIMRFPFSATEQQMRFLLTALVTGDLDDSMGRIAQRLEADETSEKGSDEVCADAIASCMPSSLASYLAELALGSFIDLPRPEEKDYLAEAETLFAAEAFATKMTQARARHTRHKAAAKKATPKPAPKKPEPKRTKAKTKA